MTDDQRPLGRRVDFSGAAVPRRQVLEGAYARLEPLAPQRHGDDLWAGACEPGADRSWDYLPYGPFADRALFDAHLVSHAARDDPVFFAVRCRHDGVVRGVISFQNIVARMGVIEIGHIWFAPSLQRTTAASEAVIVMMREAFDVLGNRRVEWKCNALNAPSRRAAERFGFAYEGTFRQHAVWKGRNRDTAWYAVIDGDWPRLRAGFAAWLDPGNFDADGHQRRTLSALRAETCGDA